MSVINSQPLIGASGNQGGAYNIERSLRFRSSASAYLNRTPASAGNRQKWTWSGWVKKGNLGSSQSMFDAYTAGSTYGILQFLLTDIVQWYDVAGGSATMHLETTQVFRDPSAWYHLVFAYDSTQATSSNRAKIYVNGSQVTSFSTTSYPSLNTNSNINNNISHDIGRFGGASNYLDGYLTEVNFVDGQQLDASSFGEIDTITGVWKPKKYAGTYGTNGFYLKFNNLTSTSTLGNDSSGNGNTWTVNNVSLTAGVTYDSMKDVPTLTDANTANYAVLNPLQNIQFGGGGSMSFSDGNLRVSNSNNSGQSFGSSSISVSSGKFYAEMQLNNNSDGAAGIWKTPIDASALYYQLPNNVNYYSGGAIYFGSSTTGTTYNSYTTGDVIGIALDMDNGKIYFSKNGTWQGSSNPATGTNPAYSGLTGAYQFGGGQGGGGGSNVFNFGQRPFAYTPPSGFVALNTFNLPTSTILAGNKYMDATTYTGTGATNAITNAGGFRPDLVWLKARSQAYVHIFTDSVRGADKQLISNNTNAEATNANIFLTSFNSNGFTVGTDSVVNQNANTYVGWQWQAGQGTNVTNTAGSITSTVSANPSAGFSIVTYTGTGANATVGHGLGVAPKMIIVKARNQAYNWNVFTAGISATQFLRLNTTDAVQTGTTLWNSTAPTSSVFSIGTSVGVNGSGDTHVAYCWSEIEGFSRFGSYTGNGNADGSFIYTGFHPKFILVKKSSAAGNDWKIVDTSRSPFNVTQLVLAPNTSGAEVTASATPPMDILSNGFKLRSTWDDFNGSGATYIFAAFAENPFKNALAA